MAIHNVPPDSNGAREAATARRSQPLLLMVTVDVETTNLEGGTLERDIWGEVSDTSERQGITKIMDVFDRHGLKATFFVNVYEAATLGEEAMADVCRCIVARGHDLELHTHPQPMFGVRAACDADLEKQTEILRTGVEMIRRWTAETVVAHRAGGYRGNYDTLTACRNVGLALDFSHNWCYHSEGFSHPPLTVNRAVLYDGVFCVPVTNYVQIRIGNWRSLRTLDIESCSHEEIRRVLSGLHRQGVRTAVIMMHSFSFVRRGALYGTLNSRVERVLDELLRHARASPHVRVVSARELYGVLQKNPDALMGSDGLPTTGWWLMYCRAWQRLGEGWKNAAVALMPLAAVLVVVAAIVCMIVFGIHGMGFLM